MFCGLTAEQRVLRRDCMQVFRSVAPLVVALFFVEGCGAEPMPKWPVSTPAELCEDPSLGPNDFCMPSAKLEGWLAQADYKITHAATSNTGVTRPYKLRLELPDGLAISVKFKRAPDEFEAFNNSPRRELAAYEIQKLFLDAADYIVPPTVLACVPIAPNASLLRELQPHPGADCALGIMAYWVEGITAEGVVDKDRWSVDQAYRDNLGNLNILTALIGHQDNIGTNFYRSKDPSRPRLVAVDNGLAFEAMGINPIQFFSSAWSDVRVPVLPAKAIERLSAVDRDHLEPLSVLAQLRLRERTYDAAPREARLDPNEGVRKHGDVVQLGLTAEEITGLGVRIAQLLGSVREGKVIEGAAKVDD